MLVALWLTCPTAAAQSPEDPDIPYVVINGTIVVKDSKVLPVKPGQQIRFPVEDKGRFKPIEVGGWLNEHTIGLSPDLAKIKLHDDTGAGAQLHHNE